MPCEGVSSFPRASPLRSPHPVPDQTMYEVRAHGELPIEGKLDGGYVRKRLEDMGLRGQFAEAIRPAEEVLHRRALGLMDQDGIPDGASQFGEGSGARDHQMVAELTGVCQESEPGHHITPLLADHTS